MISVSQILKNRFNSKFEKYGTNIKSLGWDNKKNQYIRFDIAIKDLKIKKNDTILDIGCGFGNFVEFLKIRKIKFKNYLGIDLNRNFVRLAKKKENKKIKFIELDFYKKNFVKKFDYVFMIGIGNFNLKSKNKNLNYLNLLVSKGYKISKKGLIFDFISSQDSKKNKIENFIFHYDPNDVLKFCQKLSDNFIVNHNYLKIPKKECNIKIFK